MYRCRQVRLCYPQAFVELALLLARRHGKRSTMRALALPLSTFYRWLERYPQENGNAPESAAQKGSDRLDDLIAACERHGFDVRRGISELDPASPDRGLVESRPDRHHDRDEVEVLAATMDTASSDSRLAENVSILDGEDGSEAEARLPRASESRLSTNVFGRVSLARREIDLHYYAPLSCEALGRMASMSRYHFIRMFRAAFGISPYQYLMRVRVRHAKHLLDTTLQPLDAISAAVGFESLGSLYKAFERIEHISLSRYFFGMRLGSRSLRLRLRRNELAG